VMKRPRRHRFAGSGHAPAAPRESRRRVEQIPTGADCFNWFAGEVVLSVRKPKRIGVKPDGATE
jgi:hypothetical protein